MKLLYVLSRKEYKYYVDVGFSKRSERNQQQMELDLLTINFK